MNMDQFSNMRRTAIYPPFPSQLQNFGNNNDVQMLNSNDVPPSVYGGSSFFQDSQVTNDQHLGSFAPLSNIEIPPSLNYLHPPGLLPTSTTGSTGTSSATVKEINMAQQPSRFSFDRKIFPAQNTTTMKEINMEQQPARFSFSQNRVSAQNTQNERAFQNERKRTINSENDPLLGNSSAPIEESKRKKAATCVEGRRNPHSEERSMLQTQAQKPVPVKKSQKIGDKITALQKLVSPFGKTDTASVLKEAAGHIKLLHDQIQMLSTPYFRVGSSLFHQHPQGAGEGDDDLRSRGLCLVPVSFTQNIVKDDKLDTLTLRTGMIPRNLEYPKTSPP